jgi:SAM-dependent methyltransferase
MTTVSEYPLGYSDEERRRLEWQAALLEDISRDMLVRAGLAEGMCVLDLGCGVGDVAFLAARLVGPGGSVLGVDRSASSLAVAQWRADALGLHNVSFKEAELTTFDSEGSFDAVIGRFVLLYLRDPAGLLRRLSRRVRPGGVVTFQEVDYSVAAQVPSSELFGRVRNWIFSAFDACAADRCMGGKLLATFLAAGLPRPDMIGVTQVEGGPDSPYYEFLTQMVRSMSPVMERAGIATSEEIDVETLADRLREDAAAGERVLFPPRVVGAWTRLAGA